MGLFPSISELSQAGFDALERQEWKRALRIATKLTQKRHTSGREIAARALWNLGEADKAIEELQSGIAAAPQLHIFYSYLGQYLSELGRYDEALEALYRGKLLSTHSVGTFEFNIAIVRGRQGDYLEAFEIADSIRVTDVMLPIESIRFARAYWLIKGGKLEQGLAEADQGLAESLNESVHDMAGLYAMRGYALLRLGRGEDIALEEARKAIQLNKSQFEAAEVIREIGGMRSEKAFRARVVIQGMSSNPARGRRARFLVYYEVIATSDSQVLDLVRPFECPEVRDSLQINKITWMEETPNELIGVIFVSRG